MEWGLPSASSLARYQLIADVVAETAPCGAVRHGAECSQGLGDVADQTSDSKEEGQNRQQHHHDHHDHDSRKAFPDFCQGNFYFPQARPWGLRQNASCSVAFRVE